MRERPPLSKEEPPRTTRRRTRRPTRVRSTSSTQREEEEAAPTRRRRVGPRRRRWPHGASCTTARRWSNSTPRAEPRPHRRHTRRVRPRRHGRPVPRGPRPCTLHAAQPPTGSGRHSRPIRGGSGGHAQPQAPSDHLAIAACFDEPAAEPRRVGALALLERIGSLRPRPPLGSNSRAVRGGPDAKEAAAAAEAAAEAAAGGEAAGGGPRAGEQPLPRPLRRSGCGGKPSKKAKVKRASLRRAYA